MVNSEDPAYQSLSGRKKITVMGFGIVIVVSIAALISDALQISLINRVASGIQVSVETANQNDQRQAIIGLIQIGLGLAVAIPFLMWFHRAHRNLEALNVSQLDYSAGWGVAYFFIPILNLFRPYQVMREIWKASDPSAPTHDASWKEAETPALLSSWWTCLIVGTILARLAGNLIEGAQMGEVDQLQTASYLMAVSDVLTCIAAVLVILIVIRVTERQTSKAAQRNGEKSTVANRETDASG